MNKKIFIFVLSLIIALTILPMIQNAAAAQSNVSVLIDGLPLQSDAEPVIMNGYTLLPFRSIAEALNVNVDWDGGTNTITAWNQETKVILQINNKTAVVDGIAGNHSTVNLEAPPIILNNRTLLPLRFFGEAFSCQVSWNNESREVSINSPRKDMTVVGFYALGDEKTSSWQNLFAKPYPETSPGNTDAVGGLALGWYSLDEQGNLTTVSTTGWQRPEGWEIVLQQAAAFKLNTEMVVHLTDSGSMITNLLKDPAVRTKAVNSIKNEARSYQGVNLDFEGLGWENGQSSGINNEFTAFVSELSNELKPEGLNLTLSLHPLNSVYQGYDYHALGEAADSIIIMAYDYGVKPEPENMVIQAVELALNSVPADKLVLGISLPNETPRSLAAKIGIAKRYNLQGIALWRLGLISEPMWDVIKANVHPM
ncbi:Glycosyl hydrolases family 18 [Desulfotomaculum arcticum]|uniref:Glycosyl hydrolases family 18 n=2 Tax=Desulfotruncus TaxID=2867377 RepID=A0A1I2TTB8_9FIRM|nr:Glycosyl hydrolases family 18 [Desulfotomaculum arcticum] [Desulfotruncus arcticus DSM 17038]